MPRMKPQTDETTDRSMLDPGPDWASKMCGLINCAAVRRYALGVAASQGRSRVITRIGASVFHLCEAEVRKTLRRIVHNHPSAFRTLEA